MRALVIIPSTIRGGVEEYTLRITSAAAKADWDVHAAFPFADGTLSLVEDLKLQGVHYHRLEIAETAKGRFLIARKYIPHLVKTALLLTRVKPDVVQIILPEPCQCFGSILACATLNIPTILRFGLVPYKWPYGSRELKAFAWARKRKQKLLAISENNKKLIAESFGISECEIHRIYNGSKVKIDPDSSAVDAQSLHQELSKELNIAEYSQFLLTVGRLENQKGYKDLIPAIPHILKEFPNVRFIWVGEGGERDNLSAALHEYNVSDKVFLLGFRSDIPKLLKASDLFVFPTRYEGGQSSAIAEAMAYGLPIVTSRASGIPEVIEHKVHGLLFRTGDSCDLLETLRWALRHPNEMQKMSQNAQLRAQDFTEEKMVSETLELWQKQACFSPKINAGREHLFKQIKQ